MTLKRRIFIGVASVHFLVIILHNISSTADGYQRVYANNGQTEAQPSVLAIIQKTNQSSPIAEYARFSGTETGYGFFAPQVGSQYISNFKTYNAEGKLLNETIAPNLTQLESIFRYSSFLDQFQDLLQAERKSKKNINESDSLDIRYSKAIVYSMAQRILARTPNARQVEANIYLYSYPSLKDYGKGKQPRFIPVYQATVESNPRL